MSLPTYEPAQVSQEDSVTAFELLYDTARIGWLSAELLHEVAAMLDPNPRAEIVSLGLRFILLQQSDFKGAVPPEDRANFFLAHVNNPSIPVVISNYDLFNCIPEGPQKTELLRAITARWPMPDCAWLTAVRRDVSDEIIFECMQMQLDPMRFSLEASRPFAESFLRHGAGRVIESAQHMSLDDWPDFILVDNNPKWHVVPEDKFGAIIEQCLERAPEVMFVPGTREDPDLEIKLTALRSGARQTRSYGLVELRRFLDLHKVRLLAIKAAGLLTTLEGLSVDQLLRLPVHTHEAIAKRGLPGSLEFLVRATLWHDMDEDVETEQLRLELFKSHFGLLKCTGEELLAVYRKVVFSLLLHAGESHPSAQTADRIHERFLRLLMQHGYLVGRTATQRSERRRSQTIMVSASTNFDSNDRRINLPDGRKVRVIQNERQTEYIPVETLVYVDLNTDAFAAKRVQARERIIFAKLLRVTER